MASYVKYQITIQHIVNKVIDFFGTDDTFKVALASDAPTVSSDATISDITQVANGNGYTTGGSDTQNDSTRTGGTVTETAVDVTWTASGSMGPFRYVIRYDDTPISPADPLMNYWDYGSDLTLASGETFTVDFGSSVSTIA